MVKKRASMKPYQVTYLLEGQALLSPKVHFGIRNLRKMHRLGVMAHRSEMTRAKSKVAYLGNRSKEFEV